MRLFRRATAGLTATAMAVTLAAVPAHAAEPAQESGIARDTSVAADSGVVYTLTTRGGTEVAVTPERLVSELRRDPSLAIGTPARDINATARREGNIFVTMNIYFNRSETQRIAAGATVVSLLPSGVPNPVVVAIRGAAIAITAWAGTAIALGSCVGVKTPISIGPRVPLPIYHRSGFCY